MILDQPGNSIYLFIQQSFPRKKSFKAECSVSALKAASIYNFIINTESSHDTRQWSSQEDRSSRLPACSDSLILSLVHEPDILPALMFFSGVCDKLLFARSTRAFMNMQLFDSLEHVRIDLNL